MLAIHTYCMATLHSFYTRKGYFLSPVGTAIRQQEIADEIEALLKTGAKYETRFVSSDTIVNYKGPEATDENSHEKTVLLTASTQALDRDREVIVAKGINTKFYSKNPVLAWNHDLSIPPIGRALWNRVEDNQLKVFAKFADRPKDHPESAEWLPDTIHSLCQQGIVKGVSIGFLNMESSIPTTKEIEERPELAACSLMIRKSMLLEVSIVPVGANQEALIESVSKGLVPDYTAKLLGLEPEPEDLWVWDTKDFSPEPEPTPEPVVEPAPTRLDILKRLRNEYIK